MTANNRVHTTGKISSPVGDRLGETAINKFEAIQTPNFDSYLRLSMEKWWEFLLQNLWLSVDVRNRL